MVYSGGTLPYHARPDNWRAADHGSDQEKIQSLIVHNPNAQCAKRQLCTTYDASEEWVSGADDQSSEMSLGEVS